MRRTPGSYRPSWDHTDKTEQSYAYSSGGKVPGYSGHLPMAQDHHGSSHLGGVPLWGGYSAGYDQPPSSSPSRPQTLSGLNEREQLQAAIRQQEAALEEQQRRLAMLEQQQRQHPGYHHQSQRAPIMAHPPNPNEWNGTSAIRSDEWPRNMTTLGGGDEGAMTEYSDRFYTPPSSRPLTPKASSPPSKPSQRGGTGRDIPGYAGHRYGARDIVDSEVTDNVQTFNPLLSGAPPSERGRPTVVGAKTPTTQPTGGSSRVRIGYQKSSPKGAAPAYLALASPHSRGSASSVSPQQQSPSSPDGSWQRPSFERGTPSEQTYKHVVGGVKAGYAGHIPSAQHHFGSAVVGGSVAQADPRATGSQRDHSGTRLQHERIPPIHGVSQLATSSAVGYRGNLPGELHSMGVSYWGVVPGAWANGNAPGTTPEFDA
jgi:hypothetical protein